MVLRIADYFVTVNAIEKSRYTYWTANIIGYAYDWRSRAHNRAFSSRATSCYSTELSRISAINLNSLSSSDLTRA
jgi:hypothetical protein